MQLENTRKSESTVIVCAHRDIYNSNFRRLFKRKQILLSFVHVCVCENQMSCALH